MSLDAARLVLIHPKKVDAPDGFHLQRLEHPRRMDEQRAQVLDPAEGMPIRSQA